MPKLANTTNSPLISAVGVGVLFATLAFFSAEAAQSTIQGQVVSIHDGDTLTVLTSNRQVKVRLSEIDAPELKQPFGTRSRQSLAMLCFQQPAIVESSSKDRYGRVLGRVRCNGVDANAFQVERGMAWVYVKFAKSNSPLYFLLDNAQWSREGLWSEPSPVEPWKWRHQRGTRK